METGGSTTDAAIREHCYRHRLLGILPTEPNPATPQWHEVSKDQLKLNRQGKPTIKNGI
jgi:hypothetical protein